MAKWIHTDVQDFGMAEIKEANRWHVIKAYTEGDDYTTVVGNSVGYATMAPSDYVITGAANAARVMTFASGKSFTASPGSGVSPNLHFAFVDSTTSRVLYVTDETTDVVIGNGAAVSLPSGLTYTTPRTPA